MFRTIIHDGNHLLYIEIFFYINGSIFQLTLEDVSKSKVYEFAADVWIRMDDYNDFWRELPVKKETDQLPGESQPVTLYAWLMFDMLWHVYQNSTVKKYPCSGHCWVTALNDLLSSVNLNALNLP